MQRAESDGHNSRTALDAPSKRHRSTHRCLCSRRDIGSCLASILPAEWSPLTAEGFPLFQNPRCADGTRFAYGFAQGMTQFVSNRKV
jgi:hypothetical protein